MSTPATTDTPIDTPRPRPLPLVAGNWKMHGLADSARRELEILRQGLGANAFACQVALFPPVTLMSLCATALENTNVIVGGQDCHHAEFGAHTGEISALQLKDCGGQAVLIGHSEQRASRNLSADILCGKLVAAHQAGLMPLYCVGERDVDREAGTTLRVIEAQLAPIFDAAQKDAVKAMVVAYEPVWAIGSGRVPTPKQIGEVHGFIKEQLAKNLQRSDIRVLYGGSVDGDTIVSIAAVEGVDGALVGGASLKAESFLRVLAAYGDGKP